MTEGEIMTEPRSGGERTGLAVGLLAAMGLCCGLPVLVAAGAFASAAGIVYGSLALLLVGVAVLAYAGARRRRDDACRVEPRPEPHR